MKPQPDPCPAGICRLYMSTSNATTRVTVCRVCGRITTEQVMGQTPILTETVNTQEMERVEYKQVRKEQENAIQIRSTAKTDGSSAQRPSRREKDWRTTERGTGLPHGVQGKRREAARAQREKADVEAQQRALELRDDNVVRPDEILRQRT